MKTFETNDWKILNGIIYKIYSTEDITEMRTNLLEQLKMILDFDSAEFFLTEEKNGEHLTDRITYNCEEGDSSCYDELDYSRGTKYSGKSLIYRETDMIPDEKRVETEYYNKVYKPYNWHYSIQMVLGRKQKSLGVVTLYRTIGKENFKYDDVFALDILKDHLAYRLYKEKTEKSVSSDKLSIEEATEKFELTKRERTILSLLMDGQDNQEICDELSISINTIKKHILNIYRKLNIKNRVQLFKMVKEPA